MHLHDPVTGKAVNKVLTLWCSVVEGQLQVTCTNLGGDDVAEVTVPFSTNFEGLLMKISEVVQIGHWYLKLVWPDGEALNQSSPTLAEAVDIPAIISRAQNVSMDEISELEDRHGTSLASLGCEAEQWISNMVPGGEDLVDHLKHEMAAENIKFNVLCLRAQTELETSWRHVCKTLDEAAIVSRTQGMCTLEVSESKHEQGKLLETLGNGAAEWIWKIGRTGELILERLLYDAAGNEDMYHVWCLRAKTELEQAILIEIFSRVQHDIESADDIADAGTPSILGHQAREWISQVMPGGRQAIEHLQHDIAGNENKYYIWCLRAKMEVEEFWNQMYKARV
jgi:hypothetical protein